MSCFDLKKEIPQKLKNRKVFQVSSSALKAKLQLTCCDEIKILYHFNYNIIRRGWVEKLIST